jgi:hypothetical protein
MSKDCALVWTERTAQHWKPGKLPTVGRSGKLEKDEEKEKRPKGGGPAGGQIE